VSIVALNTALVMKIVFVANIAWHDRATFDHHNAIYYTAR